MEKIKLKTCAVGQKIRNGMCLRNLSTVRANLLWCLERYDVTGDSENADERIIKAVKACDKIVYEILLQDASKELAEKIDKDIIKTLNNKEQTQFPISNSENDGYIRGLNAAVGILKHSKDKNQAEQSLRNALDQALLVRGE